MNKDRSSEIEREFATRLRGEVESFVRPFDAGFVARQAMRQRRGRLQRTVIVTAAVAVAAIFTIVGVNALTPRTLPAAVVSGSPTPTAEASPSLTAEATPTPVTEDPVAAIAQRIADRIISQQVAGSAAAAAFVTTTYDKYVASRPDTTGISAAPAPTDVVILVVIEGLFPSRHSCYISDPCVDTGIIQAYDVSIGADLETTWVYDPWSPDLPSPQASVSERFEGLGVWGTVTPLRVPD